MEQYAIKTIENSRFPKVIQTVVKALACFDEPVQPIDDIILQQALENKLEINDRETLLEKIRNIGYEGKKKWLFIIFEILKYLTMTDTVQLLVDIGQDRLATSLKLYHFGYLLNITGGCTRDLRKIRTFWFQIKKLNDDGHFDNTPLFFSSLAERYRAKINEADDKQHFADKLAVITWFQVQQYEKDYCRERRSLLENMRSSVPEGVDRSLTEIVYHSKMATTLEFEDKIEEAFDMGRKAKYLSEVFNDNSAKIMAHYSYFFYHRKLYLRDKTENRRRSAMRQCDIGCEMFLDAEDEFEIFCYLLFLLFKAGEVLQITYDLEVLDIYPVNEEEIKATEEVLDTASRFVDSKDARRELAYNLCMGRLYQIKEDYVKSAEYLRVATKCMKDGTLNATEKAHIKSFCQRVINCQGH